MPTLPAQEPPPEPLIGLGWVWRLRWGTLLGQVTAFVVAPYFLDLRLEVVTLAVLVAGLLLSNFVLARWLSRSEAARRVTALVLIFDVLLLTAVLYWSGGVANPFSAFYIIYVAIAALLLGARWALGMTVITAAAFGSLFWVPAERLGPHAHHLASPLHLQGMWAAYVLSAAFVAYFVSRVAHALRERELEMQRLRGYAAAVERVASLSTLAAGAAHELGSPLASIAVSANELARGLESSQHPLSVEALHIRSEVERCRSIIDQLVQGSGQQSGEVPVWAELRDLVENATLELEPGSRQRVHVQWGPLERSSIRCPRSTLSQVIANLLRNALDAGAGGHPVDLSVSLRGHTVQFQIHDRGVGLTPEVAGRLGEPFFTTKAPGKGMGLGLFLVKSFVKQVGGGFRLEPRDGGGATATLTLGIDLLEEQRDERA